MLPLHHLGIESIMYYYVSNANRPGSKIRWHSIPIISTNRAFDIGSSVGIFFEDVDTKE